MDGTTSRIRCILLIVTLSCYGCITAQDDKKINFEGTWAGCDEKGNYVEFHFSRYESMYVNEDIIDLAYPIPYTIQGNKIYYTNPTLEINDVDTFFLDKNLITFRNEYNTLGLQKISDFPILPLESRKSIHNISFSDSVLFVHYMRMFALRKAEYECNEH